MIEIDFNKKVYTCPFCGREQAYFGNSYTNKCGYNLEYANRDAYKDSDIVVMYIQCANRDCEEFTIVAYNKKTKKQWDLVPENVVRKFPSYIPEQIRKDYEEACMIVDKSPKAAATLLRRCLQGMIRDFWGVQKDSLFSEINELKDRVSAMQWKAIDGIRKVGNIGAHMGKDVNLIIDIDSDEALKMQKLIELLLDKWYISRHEEEKLYNEMKEISEAKQSQKKGE